MTEDERKEVIQECIDAVRLSRLRNCGVGELADARTSGMESQVTCSIEALEALKAGGFCGLAGKP